MQPPTGVRFRKISAFVSRALVDMSQVAQLLMGNPSTYLISRLRWRNFQKGAPSQDDWDTGRPLVFHYYAKEWRSAQSSSDEPRLTRSRISRLRFLRSSPRESSSPSRTRGCSMNCGN